MTTARERLLGAIFATAICSMAAREAPDPRFGVMTHFAHGWDNGLIPLVARSAVGGVRDELFWREVEPRRGEYVFPPAYDATMAALAQNGLSPLIILSFENDHHDGGATPHTDAGRAAFARYGAELVRRYGDAIKAVEVWNEFNGGFVRGPAKEGDRTAHYLRLLRSTYLELKRARPDLVVVGGATAGVPLPYWEKLLAAGALAYMDVLSVHPYRYDQPPEGIENDIAELSALVIKYNGGRPKPIWVTEIGWPTRASTAPGDLEIDDTVQAQFLVRSYALLLSAGVERVYWYLFRDYNEHVMGLVRSDGQTKPAYAAMRALARELRGAAPLGREFTADGLYSLRFRRPNNEEVRVMWSLVPRDVELRQASRVVDMLGQPKSGGRHRLDESPLFVTGFVQGLPPPDHRAVADARLGFSGTQERNGWSYGVVKDGSPFAALSRCTADDWRLAWRGDAPYLLVSSTDQHPSAENGLPVAAVRRWKSDHQGTVRISGHFRGGRHGGDGVGVGIAVDGQRRFRKVLGGGAGNAVAEHFNLTETVQPGTVIDFIVDPGPAANIDHDGTLVTASIAIKE